MKGTVVVSAKAVEYLVKEYVQDVYGRPLALVATYDFNNNFDGYIVEIEKQSQESPNELG